MVSDDPETFADLDGHDGWDVAWGVLNSLASNFVGTQRVQNGNSDVKSGQALGDALSVTVGGAATITTVVGSVAADVGSGGAALVLTPAEALVATTTANGALQGGKNLLKDAIEAPKEKSGFSQNTKDNARADAGGKCQYCGQDTTKGEQSKSGVKPPGNEGQTDHYNPKSGGGSNDPSNAVHACRDCNIEKSSNPPAGTKWQLPKPQPPGPTQPPQQ